MSCHVVKVHYITYITYYDFPFHCTLDLTKVLHFKVCPGDTTSLVYLPEQSWIGILDAKVSQLLAFTVHVEKTSNAPGMLLPGEEAPHGEAHSEPCEQPCPVI